MAKRMSHEEFENRIKEKQPEIKLLSKYVNAKTRIKCQCKTCGHIWETSPDSLNQGCGCPHCANLRKGKTKLKTHEEFVKELYEINPNIKILGKYVNARTKIKCICLIDGFEWEATPDNLLRGTGCPMCANKIKSTDIFKESLKKIQPHIEVLGEYVNNITKIKCYCKKHEYIFYSSPSDLLNGKGCRHCKSEKLSYALRMNQEDFIEKIKQVDSDILVLGRYINSHEKVLVQCKICGTKFYIIPNNAFTRGINCPCCYEKNNISKGEILVKNYLSENNFSFIQYHKFDNLVGVNGGSLSYDFYIPKLNTLIEVQGIQHKECVEYFGGIEKFKVQQEHDKRKRNYAKEHNIELIEIWYDELHNIDSILNEKLLKCS